MQFTNRLLPLPKTTAEPRDTHFPHLQKRRYRRRPSDIVMDGGLGGQRRSGAGSGQRMSAWPPPLADLACLQGKNEWWLCVEALLRGLSPAALQDVGGEGSFRVGSPGQGCYGLLQPPAHTLAFAMSHHQPLHGLWALRYAGLCLRYTADIASPTES